MSSSEALARRSPFTGLLDRRWSTPARIVAALLAASVLFAAVRLSLGVTFGSDAYSYLVSAARALHDGTFAHSSYDYTTPKPLELGVAALGHALGHALGVFGWLAALAYVGAVTAAAALAHRLGGGRAAVFALPLATTLPALVKEGLSADSTVPYAACAVGAAAIGAGRPAASALLGVGGFLRPEAWGLAAVSGALGWRSSAPRERLAAVGATVVPPTFWFAFDAIASGDPLYAAHAIARYDAVSTHSVGLASALGSLPAHWIGWPTLALGAAAVVAGLRRDPFDSAVAFPIAIAAGLALELATGLIAPSTLGRYATALALFTAVGAAVSLAKLGRHARLAGAAAGVVLCVAFTVTADRHATRIAAVRGRLASALQTTIGPQARRAAPPGRIVATDRRWQGALALYSGLARTQIVPLDAVGRSVPTSRVRAAVVLRGADRVGFFPGLTFRGKVRAWVLYAAGNPTVADGSTQP